MHFPCAGSLDEEMRQLKDAVAGVRAEIVGLRAEMAEVRGDIAKMVPRLVVANMAMTFAGICMMLAAVKLA